MNPPPPMLPASGSTTVSANPTPAAASMAFPPCLMISIPTSLASGWPDTTIALRPDTATALPASDQASGMIGRPVTTASARAPRAVGWTAVAAGAAVAQRKALEYGLAIGSTALIVADWSLTIQVARSPDCIGESNPLLGAHPSVGRVNTYFGLVTATNLAAFALPKTHRRLWYEVVVVVEAFAVTHNLAHGLS